MSEERLQELLSEVINSRLADVHTSIPGRVHSYDPSTQTADVEIVIKRAERSEKGTIVLEDPPIIPNVPVGWLSGGGYGMQFPLSKGDHVWLVFSEAATAQWRVTGEPSGPGDLTQHDISYPIALPVLRSDKEPLPNGASGALVTVPNGGTFSVSTDGGSPSPVAMADAVATELNRIKQDLTTLKAAVSSGLTAVGAGGAANGATGATAFDGAASAIPSNPGDVESSTLKAE